MKDINSFFSQSKYIFVPSKNNPRVILAVDNKYIKCNSFKLYNPFSLKAKVFKLVLNSFCNLEFFCKKFAEKHENSNFIIYLNQKFNKRFISSIYIATEKDKVVLQLQTKNRIFGYVKFPLNEIGKSRILNEKEAIEIFSNIGIIEKYILFDRFENIPFLLLKPIEGRFYIYEKSQILELLDIFKRNENYLLKYHPRVKNILNSLKEKNILYRRLNKLIESSKKFYKIVYEHGDFAPWNIIKKKNKLIPIDFEYFEKDGLEWMDFVKYYYQIGKLLKQYKNKHLIDYVLDHLDIEEKEVLFKIFLFKEIAIKIKENKSYDKELNLLKIMGVI